MIAAVTPSNSKKSMKYHKVDWKNPEDVSAFIETVSDSRTTERGELEQRWYNNILMYWGKHNLRYASASSSVVEVVTKDDWQSKMVVNKILPSVRDDEAKLTKTDPEIEVMPATNDDDDVQIANVASAVCKAYWRKLDMTAKVGELIRWARITGLAFMKVCWNPKAGPWLNFTADDYAQLFDPSQMQFAMEKFQKLAGAPQASVRMGEAEIKIEGPFSIQWDRNCSFEDSPWVLCETLRNASYIEDNWPKKLEEMRLNEGRATNSPYQSHLLNPGGDTSEYGDTVLVRELFVRRSEKLPKGHYAVFAGGLLCESGENPYVGNHDDTQLDIPISKLEDLPIPGRTYPTSTVEQLIDIQLNTNEWYNWINDSLSMMANPMWVTPKSSIASGQITNMPGQVAEYNGNKEPQRVEGVGVPTDVFNFIDKLQGEYQDISGQHQVSMARAPSANSSGYQTEILREIDDTRLGPFAKSLNRCVSRGFMNLLNVMSLYMNEERMVRICGKSRQYDVQVMFDGNALMGQNAGKYGINYFDVQVDFVSTMSESNAARREAMFEAINRGVLNVQDPTDKGQIMQYFGFLARGSDFFHKLQEDQSKQMDENRRMEKGEQIPVQPWENHVVELDVIARRMKQADFNELDPQIQQGFISHWQQHQQYATGAQYAGVQPGQPPEQQVAMAQGAQMAQ